MKDRILIGDEDTNTQDIQIPDGYLAKKFVYLAIKIIKIHMNDNDNDNVTDQYETIKISKAIEKFLTYDANNISVVFKYIHNYTYLLTGDASISVFERLLNEGKCIHADILKVPHHGSRNSLNKYILMNIYPKIAIVSHGNRRFGKDPDSHPHKEVIHILNKLGILTYYTNDVIKDRKYIIKGHNSPIQV